MPQNPISEAVLAEILSTYVAAELRPSDKVVQELSAATGVAEQRVKNDYTRLYQRAGNEDDPWAPDAILGPDDE